MLLLLVALLRVLFCSFSLSDILNSANDGAYPIVAFSSLVLQRAVGGPDCRAASALVEFVHWATTNATASQLVWL